MAAALLNVSTTALHALLGGMAIFCLFYAAFTPYPEVVSWLLLKMVQYGGMATALAYLQGKYLV